MKKNIFIILALSLVFFIANAQHQDYTEHKIKSGESLYALTKKYKVSLQEIKDANPDLGAKIDIGTIVKIPKKGTTAKKQEKKPVEKKEEKATETAKEEDNSSNDFIKHKLKAKESFAVLSRKYGVSIADIKKANSSLGKAVKVGTIVNIPKKESEPIKEEVKVEEPKNETPAEETSSSDVNVIKHKLKAKESFAVLSRKYKVSIADIKKANPKLGKAVKVGTIINIPQKATEKPVKEIVKEEQKQTEKVVETTQENNESEEVYIFHKVKSKETLSTISKKYKKTLTQIKKANPSIGSKGLKIGQLVKIPTGKKAPKQEIAAPAEEEDVPSTPNSAGEITHKVKAKQTLFSIAKEYKVSVNDIKKWNNMTGQSHLKLGQELIIKTREDIAPAPKKEVVEEDLPPAVDQIKPNTKPSTDPKPATGNTEPDEPIKPEPAKPIIALKEPEPPIEVDLDKVKVTTSTAVNASGYSKITETGLAELMVETVESTKFLAMHKTAPIGTLIQVKNPMTGVAIFVRIIGKLPDNSANDKIIIKVTKKVRERIGALNNRFPVEISYIP